MLMMMVATISIPRAPRHMQELSPTPEFTPLSLDTRTPGSQAHMGFPRRWLSLAFPIW